LAFYLDDGRVVCLGRADSQVKIRGNRLEPGEVESVLKAAQGVIDAVVVAREDQPNEKRLVAYVRLKDDVGDQKKFIEALRASLTNRLPDYMIPSAIVLLDEFPTTSGGKLDQKALPKPEVMFAQRAIAKPRSDTELVLYEIWSEILGLEEIGVHDDFFQYGGNSLSVIKTLSRMRKVMGADIPVSEFFFEPTIAQLAQRIDEHAKFVHRCLVTLNHDGPAPSIFCVHAVDGAVMAYSHFAHIFNGKRRCYGLQSRGLLPNQSSQHTISEMAKTYLKEIKTVQPNGPYNLLGWSDGGIICIEMARQLEQRGERVGAIIFIDAFVIKEWPDNLKKNSKGQLDALKEFALLLAANADEKIDIDMKKYEEIKILDKGFEFLFPLLQENEILPEEVSVEDFKKHFSVFLANIVAAEAYRFPQLEQDFCVINASDHSGMRERDYHAITTGKIDEHIIKGNHFTLLSEGVTEVSNYVEKYLQRWEKVHR